MKGATVLLVACAAFAAFCSVDASTPAMSYQGGYSCGGKISKIDCYAPDGVVKGLVYQNTNDVEATAICDYPFVNGGPDWTDKALVLDADESIISIQTCRGGFYGYSSVTVTTDKGRTWTCGGGSNSYKYKPPSWNGCGGLSSYKSYGCYQPFDYSTKYRPYSPILKRYQQTRGLLAAESVAESHEGRQLQEEGDPDTFYFGKGWGWGWSGQCQTYRSPKQPKWSTCGGTKCNNWWTGKNKRFGSYGYVSNSAYYYKQWGSLNKYYKHNSGGKSYLYYQSRTLYNKYNSYCSKNSCNYVPKCYYDENYPLASFSGICDKSGYIYNLYGFCWNDNFTPPPPPSALMVEIIFESDAGQPCVNIDGTPIDINAVLGQMTRYLAIAAPSLIKEITYYTSGYKCTPASGGNNATATIALGFVPADGKTIADLLAYFAAVPILPGTTDLCSFPPVTDPATGISFGPCVGELDSAIVNGYDGSGVVSKKKKVSVKQAMQKIETKYASSAHLSRRYSSGRAKHVPHPYTTRAWGWGSYAKSYLAVFPKGYTKNMKKTYGNDWKKKMKKTYVKKRGL